MSLPNCKAAGIADSIRGPQDPSGPDASLTIKAEKTPLGALEKWGHALTAGKKSVSLPSDCEKGLEMDKRHWAKQLFAENHLIRLIKNDTGAGHPQAIPRGFLGKTFWQFDLWIWG